MKKFCSNCNKKVKVKNVRKNSTDRLFTIVMLFLTFGMWFLVIGIDAYFSVMEGNLVCSNCGKKIV